MWLSLMRKRNNRKVQFHFLLIFNIFIGLLSPRPAVRQKPVNRKMPIRQNVSSYLAAISWDIVTKIHDTDVFLT